MSFLSTPFRTVLSWCLVLLLGSCIDPYSPDAINSPRSYLVVDGYINSTGVTQIKLTRTYNIAATAPPVETRATLFVEEEGGPRYALREGAAGTYATDPLSLNSAKRYRLHITTTGGQAYASEFMPVKTAPPIDNVTWQAEDDGLAIYVNSHDATGNSRFYQWEYEETWETIPTLTPEIEYVNRQIRPLTTGYPQRCWTTARSSGISIGKTTNLSQDIVSDYKLRTLPANSERLAHKYSILVKQSTLTREEYSYWELLKKNTENIGTLFDPLPSQLTGNIRSLTDESELALGFIGVHSVEEKRIFINRGQLPTAWRSLSGYESCMPPDTVDLNIIRGNLDIAFGGGYTVPLWGLYRRSGALWGYTSTTLDCVDCRRRGTDVRPAFWQ